MEEIPIEEFEDDFRPPRLAAGSAENLQPEPPVKVVELHSAPIISEQVREFVRERIDFPLTNRQWLVIDVAMGKFWNNRVSGTWICIEDVAGCIYRHCGEAKMLISWERILKISEGIWEYLELKGRLVDDNRM